MLTFLWFAFWALSYILGKWFLEGEPSRRVWTVVDIVLLIVSSIMGPIYLVVFVMALAMIFFSENYDREVFRIGKRKDKE